jgi:hypothetical protein
VVLEPRFQNGVFETYVPKYLGGNFVKFEGPEKQWREPEQFSLILPG